MVHLVGIVRDKANTRGKGVLGNDIPLNELRLHHVLLFLREELLHTLVLSRSGGGRLELRIELDIVFSCVRYGLVVERCEFC